jgi:hypothetical protein
MNEAEADFFLPAFPGEAEENEDDSACFGDCAGCAVERGCGYCSPSSPHPPLWALDRFKTEDDLERSLE